MGLADEKYVSFTTFKKDGTPVATATWLVPLDSGAFGFWTSSATGKAKRLTKNAKVVIQPSNSRGKVKEGTSPVEATAVLVAGGPEFEEITRKVKAKYGIMTNITRFLAKVGGLVKRKPFPYADRCVVITVPADSAETAQ